MVERPAVGFRLSRLVYEHHAQMAASLRGRLIQVVLLLLEDQDAQVGLKMNSVWCPGVACDPEVHQGCGLRGAQGVVG